jgi:hypothetical protein
MGEEDRKINGLHSAYSETFARQGYVVLPSLVEPSLKNFLWSYVHTKSASKLLSTGDALVPSAPGAYGDPTFDGLLEFLRPRLEEHIRIMLLPTYSYFRIYRHGDMLKRHRDRPACEISISLNLGQEPADPWPLYIDGKTGVHSAILLPGDSLIYRGVDYYHWRERYEGNHVVQAFLHYVERDGAHKDQKFDQRTTLMRPRDIGTGVGIQLAGRDRGGV